MGSQGTGKSLPGDIVLDAGGLISFERGDQNLAGLLKSALAVGSRVVVPASVLAQVWRGGSRSASLSRLIGAAEVDGLSEDRAKEVGARLGYRGTRDIADGHVVCCAVEHRAAVATSDPNDIQALLGPAERLVLIAV